MKPDRVVIVDNASPDSLYLDEIERSGAVEIIRNEKNEGFCTANNIGYRIAKECDYVLFLNPDAFPATDLLEKSLKWMEQTENARTAVLSGTLLRFDLNRGLPTGAIDSTGIYQSWYGKWYDRRQGDAWTGAPRAASPEHVPAICGALMFCRTAALESATSPNGEVFDSRFFMYKEDIDLSLRLRRQGWNLVYLASLICYHCRGWQGRSRMSKRARYLSARNELRVCVRNRGKGIFYSTAKFLFVVLNNFWAQSR